MDSTVFHIHMRKAMLCIYMILELVPVWYSIADVELLNEIAQNVIHL